MASSSYTVDAYARQATQSGFRARSAFKLLEMNRKERFLRSGLSVLDLGAAPGSWSQVCRRTMKHGCIVAIDCQPMRPIEGVKVLTADLSEAHTMEQIRKTLPNGKADLVISDAAPTLSGSRIVDQGNAEELWQHVYHTVHTFLRPGGTALIKLFAGEMGRIFEKTWRARFGINRVMRPAACRKNSTEYYVFSRLHKSPLASLKELK